tara:strand:+ start:132 stop:689 length:558 start_codon:yes stop_codon:yes gene_type:complete
MSRIKEIINQHFELKNSIQKLSGDIDRYHSLIFDCLNKGNKLMICGNGGSAADAQHIAAEFSGRFVKERKPLNAIALTTDTSAITAISNDYSFDDIFSRQIEAIGSANDILLGISTSGNSKNVINAVKKAKEHKILTCCLIGNNGGELLKLSDNSIVIKSNNTARIQEMHILIGHILCDLIDSYF